MRTKWMGVICALLVVSAAAGCGTAATHPANNTAATTTSGTATIPPEPTYTGPVVATYDGGVVRKDELDKAYNLQIVLPGYQQQETKAQFLTTYVTVYRYAYDQAQKGATGKVDPAKAVQLADQSLGQLVGTNYKTKADVQKAMSSLGLTQDDLIRLSAKQLVMQQYFQSREKNVAVSDQQAKDYYNKHTGDFTIVTVDHILLNNLAQAKEVEAKLKGGADFAKMADQYSTDPGAKQNHGTYADQPAGQFVPEFAKACETLPIGQISDPVHTQFGYHVMRVDKRTVTPFEQAKDQVKQQLMQQQQNEQSQAIYQDLQKAAKMKVVAKATDL